MALAQQQQQNPMMGIMAPPIIGNSSGSYTGTTPATGGGGTPVAPPDNNQPGVIERVQNMAQQQQNPGVNWAGIKDPSKKAPAGAVHRRQMNKFGKKWINKRDFNNNGVVSSRERNRFMDNMNRLDLNNDGRTTANEIRQGRGERNWLAGDAGYQQQLAGYKDEFQNYLLKNRDAIGDVRQTFRLTNERMGQERDKSLQQMMDDFGARGMLQSGEYLRAQEDYNKEYQNRLADLTRDRTNSIEDLRTQRADYRRKNTMDRQNARLESIRRRAERLGLK